MINNILNEAINSIDDDLISNAHSNNSSKKSYKKYLAIAAVFTVVIMAVVVGSKSFEKPIVFSEKTETTTDGLYYGGAESEKISNSDIVVSGTAFSDDEIIEHLEKYKYDIVGAIAAEYSDFDSEYSISTKGYYHISLGETNTLDLNVITLPISVNSKIVASVTLIKNGEEIIQSISARGEGFDRLNKVLNDNKENEFAFFFVDGMTEIAISPTNDIYIIKGKDTVNLDNKVDYYGKYKTDKNVFSYDALTNDNYYLKVTPLPEEKVTLNKNTTVEDSFNNEKQTEVIPFAQNATINLTVNDILSKNISSIEWIDSYEMLSGSSYHSCSEKETEDIISYISNIEFTENPNYEEKYGGAFYVRFMFDDGSFATIVLLDEDFYIETPNGHSPIYTDATENTVKLIYYLVESK